MSPPLILEKNLPVPLRVFGKFCAVYGLSTELKQQSTHCKTIIVPDDLMMARDWIACFHRACVEGDRIYSHLIEESKFDFLSEIGPHPFPQFLIKKRVLQYLEKTFVSIAFAESIRKEYNLDQVYFAPNCFPYAIYKSLKHFSLWPEWLVIPKRIQAFIFGIEYLKAFYFLCKSEILPQQIRKSLAPIDQNIEPQKFKVAVLTHSGRGFKNCNVPMDFFIGRAGISAHDVVYVLDEKESTSFVDEAKGSGYHVVNFFSDLANKVTKQAFKTDFNRILTLKRQARRRALQYPYLMSALYSCLQDHALWSLFFKIYTVQSAFCIQHPGPLTRAPEFKKRGVRYIFVHNSITTPRLDRIHVNHAEYEYYSHLIYDTLISDKNTGEWLKSCQNHIGEYIPNGSLFSDYVFRARTKNFHSIREQLGVGKDKILISFFDHTVGYKGVLTHHDYKLFLESIIATLNHNETYVVAYKPKKNWSADYLENQPLIASTIKSLLNHPRFILASSTNFYNYEYMGASDLVVSAPISSVIFESVIGGVKTISFDVAKKYDQSYIISECFPYFSVHGIENLQEYIHHWLFEVTDEQFVEFQNKYIKPNFDQYCDGQAIERFARHLVPTTSLSLIK